MLTALWLGSLTLNAPAGPIAEPDPVDRIEGVDHGYFKPSEPPGPPAGMQAVFAQVLAWFFGEKHK